MLAYIRMHTHAYVHTHACMHTCMHMYSADLDLTLVMGGTRLWGGPTSRGPRVTLVLTSPEPPVALMLTSPEPHETLVLTSPGPQVHGRRRRSYFLPH